MNFQVRDFASAPVHTIRADATVAEAHAMMRAHSFRHLPVLAEGKLVGLVAQGDLHLVETLGVGSPEEITIEEAMSEDVLTVGPEDSIAEVAAGMAKRRTGCAVVIQDGKVAGIFTTRDALRALAELQRAESALMGDQGAQHP